MTPTQKKTTIDAALLAQFMPLNVLAKKHLEDLVKYSKVVQVKSKTLLFKRGVRTVDKMYLLSGSVDLCDANFQIKTLESSQNHPSTSALNPSNPTQSAAITTSTSTILLISSDRLDLILTWAQAGDYLVEDHDEEHAKPEDRADWMSDLLHSHLLQKIPPSHIQQLFLAFKQDSFRKDNIVIQQGDIGEYFYVLQQGTAQVFQTDDQGHETNLATLSAGQFFGEEALISDNRRNASIRMLTDGACMKLNKASFNTLLKEPVLEKISAKQVQQMQSTNPQVRIIDLRTREEAALEPLENALHIPLADLRQRLHSLDDELTYITHTINGRRAELGAYLLSDAGFTALVMK